jgi:hypothetical protein
MQSEKARFLMSQLCLTFSQNKRFCQNIVTEIDRYKMQDQQQEASIDSFFDLTDEEISKLAKEATRAAVKDLHDRGISTYGMRDGIIYETKPNGGKVQNERISTTS